MVHVFVCMVFTMIFSTHAMDNNESQKLLENIQEMQVFHQSHNQNILTKFERVFHVPIQPKEGQTWCIAKAIGTITERDWKKLKKKRPDAYEHTQNSVVWTFVQLPGELQHTIISAMMGYDEDVEKSDEFVGGDEEQQQELRQEMACRKMAIDAFMRTPFLHAIDRWSRIVALQSQEEQLQKREDVELFVTTCPYSLPIYVTTQLRTINTCVDCVLHMVLAGSVGAVLASSVGGIYLMFFAPVSRLMCHTVGLSTSGGGCVVGSVLAVPVWKCAYVLNKHGLCCCIPGAVTQYKTFQVNENTPEDESMCCAQWIKKNK